MSATGKEMDERIEGKNAPPRSRPTLKRESCSQKKSFPPLQHHSRYHSILPVTLLSHCITTYVFLRLLISNKVSHHSNSSQHAASTFPWNGLLGRMCPRSPSGEASSSHGPGHLTGMTHCSSIDRVVLTATLASISSLSADVSISMP